MRSLKPIAPVNRTNVRIVSPFLVGFTATIVGHFKYCPMARFNDTYHPNTEAFLMLILGIASLVVPTALNPFHVAIVDADVQFAIVVDFNPSNAKYANGATVHDACPVRPYVVDPDVQAVHVEAKTLDVSTAHGKHCPDDA
jgi:hypothetical protein